MSAPAARATPLDLSYLENHGFLELHDGGNEQLHRHIWSNGRHDGLDSKVVRHGGVAEAIRVALELAEIPDITRVNEFVPLDSFGRIINKTTISQLLRELKSCKTMSSSKREQLANEICSTTPQHSCRKVVAALIRIKKEEEIPNIVQEGFRDDCLPLHLLTDTQLYHRQTSRTCESMRKWNPKERRKYWKASQKFSCPVFMRPPGKVCHYVLYEPVRLPFEEEVQSFEERDSDFGAANGNGGDEEAGGYGAVARVRIHAGHHNFGDYGVCILAHAMRFRTHNGVATPRRQCLCRQDTDYHRSESVRGRSRSSLAICSPQGQTACQTACNIRDSESQGCDFSLDLSLGRLECTNLVEGGSGGGSNKRILHPADNEGGGGHRIILGLHSQRIRKRLGP